MHQTPEVFFELQNARSVAAYPSDYDTYQKPAYKRFRIEYAEKGDIIVEGKKAKVVSGPKKKKYERGIGGASNGQKNIDETQKQEGYVFLSTFFFFRRESSPTIFSLHF